MEKYLKEISILILTVFLSQISLAQDSEETILKIRDRYYRIISPNVTLEKITYRGVDYYLENDKLSIAKKEHENGRFEYYYDLNSDKYYPYFIYFKSYDQGTPDLRAYYDDKSLVLFKENQEEKELSSFNNQYSYLELDAYNSINTFFNMTELAKFPNDDKIDAILEKVKKLNSSIFKTDTIKYNSDDGGENGVFVYLDKRNAKLIKDAFSGGEHGGGSYKEYFENNRLIYSTSEYESWVGNMSWVTITICYFNRGEIFRKDQYNSHGISMIEGNDTRHFLYFNDLDKVTPRIRYTEKNDNKR